jgi:EAL domain-containing protein (putative c-di-GMP-specific phosphodiesterase class I)
MRDADTALYRAKEKGRDCYQIFDGEMHASAVRLLRLESDLRQAVAREAWQLHFQPIVAAHPGPLLGFEALLRWKHPERGLVYPGEFVRLAEDTGLIVPIGAYVLRAACAQARRWHDQGHSQLWVAVNISPRQLLDQDLAAVAGAALEAVGLPARALKLEITESVALRDYERSLRQLRALRDLGVDVLLDDFGQGYSSFSHLQRLPLQALKIDKAFVQAIGASEGSRAITGAMIGLGHNLGLTVIAEGVETAAQLQFLRDHGCDALQGYLIQRPAPPENVSPGMVWAGPSLAAETALGWQLAWQDWSAAIHPNGHPNGHSNGRHRAEGYVAQAAPLEIRREGAS